MPAFGKQSDTIASLRCETDTPGIQLTNSLFVAIFSCYAHKNSLFGSIGNWPLSRWIHALIPVVESGRTPRFCEIPCLFSPFSGIPALQTGWHQTASTTRPSRVQRGPLPRVADAQRVLSGPPALLLFPSGKAVSAVRTAPANFILMPTCVTFPQSRRSWGRSFRCAVLEQ